MRFNDDDSDDEEQKSNKLTKKKSENDRPGKSTPYIPFIPKFLFASLKEEDDQPGGNHGKR